MSLVWPRPNTTFQQHCLSKHDPISRSIPAARERVMLSTSRRFVVKSKTLSNCVRSVVNVHRYDRNIHKVCISNNAASASETAKEPPVDAPSTAMIVGGGPAGLATAIMLARRGWRDIRVYERLPPPPTPESAAWGDPYRSYNMGLTGRGQAVLKNLDILERVERYCAVTAGRMDWNPGSDKANERIFANKGYTPLIISRDRLTSCLLQEIKERYTDQITEIMFNCECTAVEWITKGKSEYVKTRFETKGMHGDVKTVEALAPFVIGADGAGARIRNTMESDPQSQQSEFKVKRYDDDNVRVYKTLPLHLPEGWRGDLNYSARTKSGLNLDALPTKEGAMIAVVLFRPEDTRVTELTSASEAKALFQEHFPQFAPMLRDEDLVQFVQKPVSRLPTFTFCGPVLHRGSTTVLLGDAIHTVKPYFGLGVNAAFEDIQVLDSCLEEAKDAPAAALPLYSERRAQDARVLVELSRSLDYKGILGAFTFIIPIIMDSIFHKLLPSVFGPNILNTLQNHKYSFTEVRRKKRMDRVAQLLSLAVLVTIIWAGLQALFQFVLTI